MARKKQPGNSGRVFESFVAPLQCFNDITQAWTDYLKIVEQEATKRCEIEAWERSTLAIIQVKRDFLIGYLDRSFDERAQNFQALFKKVDDAISSRDNQQLGLLLHTIGELAKSSPFKDLSDLSTVKAALDDPDHIWEF
jgi:hypothetical protein